MKNNATDKIALFETIGSFDLFLARRFLRKNYKVFFFSVNEHIKKNATFERLLNSGSFGAIPSFDFNFNDYYIASDRALSMVEKLYESVFKKKFLVKLMGQFFDSGIINASFQKMFAERIYHFYKLHQILQLFLKENKNADVVFIAKEYQSFLKLLAHWDETLAAHPGVYYSFWSSWFQFSKKIKAIANLLLLPFSLFMHIKKITFFNKRKRNFHIGIRCYENDFGFYSQYRTVDFLVDGTTIRSDNSLFCVESEISARYESMLKERKYAYIVIPRLLQETSLRFLIKMMFGRFGTYWFLTLIASCFEADFTVRNATLNFKTCFLWERFLDEYCLKHFIVCNNFENEHVARNILFSKKGITTWYYVHSSNFADANLPEGNNGHIRHAFFAFLYYDILVSWGERTKKFFNRHPHYIGKFMNVGCIWSEHVRMAVSQNGSSTLLEKIKTSLGLDTSLPKIISVFDTTFWGDVPLTRSDMERFLDGIIKILDSHPDVIAILKRKWDLKEMEIACPGSQKLFEKILGHRRCFSPRDENLDVSEVIAISDLVVSACFTSTAIEALGARKKSIFFDAANRFSGTYYDKFPRLAAHSYAELEEYISYWLYTVKGKEFDDYLEKYVKGELDAFVDGNAITRFRQALCN